MNLTPEQAEQNNAYLMELSIIYKLKAQAFAFHGNKKYGDMSPDFESAHDYRRSAE